MAALRTARMAVIRAAHDGVAAAILQAVPTLADEDGRGTLLTKRVYERVAASMSAAAARQDAQRLATLAYAVGQLARRAPDAQACIATGLLRDLARVVSRTVGGGDSQGSAASTHRRLHLGFLDAVLAITDVMHDGHEGWIKTGEASRVTWVAVVTLLCKLCTLGIGSGAIVRHRGIESLSELFGGKLRSRLAALLLASSSPAAAEAAAALKRLVTGICSEPEFRVRALLLELVYKLVYTLNKGPQAAKAASIVWRRALTEAFRGADANAMLESSPKAFAAEAAGLAARVAPAEETMVEGVDKVALPQRAVELPVSHMAVSESSITMRTRSGVYVVVPLGTLSRATPREGRTAVELKFEARSLSSLQLAADTLAQCGGAIDDMAPQHRPSRQVWTLPDMHMLFAGPRVLDAVMVLLRDRAAAGSLQDAVAAAVMAQSRNGPCLGRADTDMPASQAMYEQESALQDGGAREKGKPAPKSSRTQLLPVHTTARLSSQVSRATEPVSVASAGQARAGTSDIVAAPTPRGEERDAAQGEGQPAVAETPETVCEEEEAESVEEEEEGKEGAEAHGDEEYKASEEEEEEEEEEEVSSTPEPEATPHVAKSARGARVAAPRGRGRQTSTRQDDGATGGGRGQRRRMPSRRVRLQAEAENRASTPESDQGGEEPVREPAGEDHSPSGTEKERDQEVSEVFEEEEDGETPVLPDRGDAAAYLDQLLEVGGGDAAQSDSEEPAPAPRAQRAASAGGRRGGSARAGTAPSGQGAKGGEGRTRKRGRSGSAARPRGGAMAVIESLAETPAHGDEEDRGSTDDEASGAMRDALRMLLTARAKKRRKALGRRQETIKAAVRAKVEKQSSAVVARVQEETERALGRLQRSHGAAVKACTSYDKLCAAQDRARAAKENEVAHAIKALEGEREACHSKLRQMVQRALQGLQETAEGAQAEAEREVKALATKLDRSRAQDEAWRKLAKEVEDL